MGYKKVLTICSRLHNQKGEQCFTVQKTYVVGEKAKVKEEKTRTLASASETKCIEAYMWSVIIVKKGKKIL